MPSYLVRTWRRVVGARFPDDLPLLFSGIVALLTSVYLLAPVFAESGLGRPSSTSGIGFFMAPIAGLLAGSVAYVVGMGLRWILASMGVASRKVPGWLLIVALLATGFAAVRFSLEARTSVIRQEFERRPRVIVDLGRLRPMSGPGSVPRHLIEGSLVFPIDRRDSLQSATIDWNGRTVNVLGSDEQVRVLDVDGQILASMDLHDFDYITRIRVLPVCPRANGDKDLALLVTLRATSKRSMLVVFGPDGEVVYQHHLERTGRGSAEFSTLYSGVQSDTLVVEHGASSVWTCR